LPQWKPWRHQMVCHGGSVFGVSPHGVALARGDEA
jgi:hypothetical protein